MTLRKDNSIIKSLSVDNYQDRTQLREYLLKQFIAEECKIKLRYFVEKLDDNKRIYIERPGRLNKGCDFVIYVEDLILYGNGNDKPPKHNDLINDLKKKKKQLSNMNYSLLINSITDIYNLKSFLISYSQIQNLQIVEGWSYELILKLTRWFFIEQDITYWARSGREMLLLGIKNI